MYSGKVCLKKIGMVGLIHLKMSSNRMDAGLPRYLMPNEQDICLQAFRFGCASTNEKAEIFKTYFDRHGDVELLLWLLRHGPSEVRVNLFERLHTKYQNAYIDHADVAEAAWLLGAAHHIWQASIVNRLEKKRCFQDIVRIFSAVRDNNRLEFLEKLSASTRTRVLAQVDSTQIEETWLHRKPGRCFTITPDFLAISLPKSARQCSRLGCFARYDNEEGRLFVRLGCDKHSCHIRCYSAALEDRHSKKACRTVRFREAQP